MSATSDRIAFRHSGITAAPLPARRYGFFREYHDSAPHCCRWTHSTSLTPGVRLIGAAALTFKTPTIKLQANNALVAIHMVSLSYRLKRMLARAYFRTFSALASNVMLTNANLLLFNESASSRRWLPIVSFGKLERVK